MTSFVWLMVCYSQPFLPRASKCFLRPCRALAVSSQEIPSLSASAFRATQVCLIINLWASLTNVALLSVRSRVRAFARALAAEPPRRWTPGDDADDLGGSGATGGWDDARADPPVHEGLVKRGLAGLEYPGTCNTLRRAI